MTKTREFFERVLVWPGPDGPGYINLHWTSPKGPGVRGRPFKEIDKFLQAAKNPAYKDVYFCLSTQAKTKTIQGDNGDFVVAARHANDALALKAVWLDVDVKPEKGYTNKNEMLDAVLAFAKEAKIPFPSAIVYSGSGGAHFYWISETSLTPEEWRPYAEGLKAAALKFGLKFDAGVTSDAARILRVPETFNWKDPANPRPVTIAYLGESYNFAKDLEGIFKAPPQGRIIQSITAQVPEAKLAALDIFAGGPDPAFADLDPTAGATSFLLEPKLVFQKCLSLCNSFNTQGANDGQGIWSLNLLATTFMKDGREIAHSLSNGYPKYSKEETDAKYDEKVRYKTENRVGWPSCKAFEAEGAPCKDCQFKGKVKSPLNLADRTRVPLTGGPETAPPPQVTDALACLDLPSGYELDEHGWIAKKAYKKVPGGQGAEAEYLVPLFMCKLRNFVLQAGDRKILFECSLDAGRWGQCALSESDLASDQKTLAALRRDGVKPYPENQSRIIQFMTSFSAKIDSAKRRIQTLPFGWLRDEDTQEIQGFAYGGRVVLRGGKTQTAGYADRQLKDWYEPKGTIEPWLKALKLVTDQHHPPLEAVIAASFGAPLMVFLNKYSSTMFNWSPASGAHKSTSMDIGLAVWSMPQMTKESPMSSLKGVIHKLGYIRHLPVFWDEIDTDEKLDDVRKILSVATEGSGGSLLHQDRSFRERDAWQTIMVVAANRSLIGNIARNVKDTDAKMQRVFEFIVPPRGDTARESEVSKLIGSLNQNYGHMGLRWQEVLGSDPEGVAEQVAKVNKQFEDETGHTSPERFRMAMIVCIYVGAQYANTLGATFNLDELWVWLKQQYAQQRKTITESETVGGTKSNTANALTEFFKENVRHALWVDTFLPGTQGVAPILTYKAGPTRDRPARIDIRLRIDDRLIEISRGKLVEYLARAKHNPIAVLNGLKTYFDMEVEDKVNLAAGSGVLGGREKILRIPVPLGSPLQPLLYMHTPPEMRPEGVIIEDGEV